MSKNGFRGIGNTNQRASGGPFMNQFANRFSQLLQMISKAKVHHAVKETHVFVKHVRE